MEPLEKLKLLSANSNLESAEDTVCINTPPRQKSIYTHNAILPNGKRIKLLKSLLSSFCENNCFYCPFRAGRDFHRETFRPDEYARLIMNMYQAGIIQGAFISSGIAGSSVRVQDKLLETAEILRYKLHYSGYLHLKLMPGIEFAQVEQAMRLADRVSLNLEAPNPERLAILAPEKSFNSQLLKPLEWVQEIRRNHPSGQAWKKRWPSSTTQFVVGGAGESDNELLKTTQYLYHKLGLSRAYFSLFRPIINTPFENHKPIPLKREQRLYQASFLMRDYSFSLEELYFDRHHNLPLDIDPKSAWAKKHYITYPVEVNRADKHELLRIPGIGPKSVSTILKARKSHQFKDIAELGKLGISAKRVAPYILLAGKKPPLQLALF
ncbi:MAG TPA: radical SAM protein [Anaerolineae bacterium]|nr:radical SAM protein [Anaerolineae bacterium]